MILWGSLCDIVWMAETTSVIEIYYCKMVEYDPMAFVDDYLELLDNLDLAGHCVEGSVWFLHSHLRRLNVVDYCHSKIKIVKI